MTLTDLTTISDEARRGIVDAHKAAWQRIRDSRFTTLHDRNPEMVAVHGENAVRDAVGITVAAEMLRASAELLSEIATARGVGSEQSKRGIVALLEGA